MTSSDAISEVELDPSNLEVLADQIFTRSHTCETNLKILQAVVSMMLDRKRGRTSILEGEVVKLKELVEMLALIVSKTYAELRDSFSLADDEALTFIRDLLVQYNPSIVNRNRSKKIPKHLFR